MNTLLAVYRTSPAWTWLDGPPYLLAFGILSAVLIGVLACPPRGGGR